MRNFQSTMLTCLFLTYCFFAQAQSPEQEPNNEVITANILPLNGDGSGSIEANGTDWWKVQTDAEGRLDITIQNQGATGRIYLQLYDSAALHFIDSFSVNSGSTSSLSTDGLGAGFYCIKLSCGQPSVNSYILSNEFIKAGGINDPEPADIRIAPVFNLEDTVSGHIGYYHNGTRDEIDFFKFSTRFDGNIYVTFSNNSLSDTLLCEILDSVANLYDAFVPPGQQRTLNLMGMQAGTYRIKVTNDIMTTSDGFGPYSFTSRMDSVTHPNDIEPNDKPKQALPLPVNSSTPGHILYYYNGKWDVSDWYKVVLPEDGMFKISLSSDTLWGRMFFNLYDCDAKTLLKRGAVNALKKADFFTDGVAAGTYYIEVTQRRNNFNTNTYTLWDSLFTYAYDADSLKEKNNQPYKASNIFINKPIQGHVGFYYNSKRDSADWWKLNYTDASGKLRIYLKLLPALVDDSIRSVQVQFYSDTLAAPVYSGVFNDTLNIATLSRLKKGLYYIKLNCFDTLAGWSAYALKVGGENKVNFSASLQDGMPLLEWTTSDETDVKGYEIEASDDGIHFSTIGFSASKPVISSNYYSYADVAASDSKYYRLKQLNKTGGHEYSSIVSVKPQNFQWYVINNGNTSKVYLHLNEQSKVILQVISSNGVVATSVDKGNLSAGSYTIPLNLSNRAPGIYTLKLMVNQKVSSEQFFKP